MGILALFVSHLCSSFGFNCMWDMESSNRKAVLGEHGHTHRHTYTHRMNKTLDLLDRSGANICSKTLKQANDKENQPSFSLHPSLGVSESYSVMG